MLQELVAGWVAEGREQGIEQGIEQGRGEERRLLCRQAARKFTPETAPRLSVLLERLTDPESLLQVGDWIIECKTERGSAGPRAGRDHITRIASGDGETSIRPRRSSHAVSLLSLVTAIRWRVSSPQG